MTTATDHVLYRIFDGEDRLLYVGITMSPLDRWKQHAGEKPWWSERRKITTEPFSSRAEVLKAERAAIIAERPLHNVVHNRGNAPVKVPDLQPRRGRYGHILPDRRKWLYPNVDQVTLACLDMGLWRWSLTEFGAVLKEHPGSTKIQMWLDPKVYREPVSLQPSVSISRPFILDVKSVLGPDCFEDECSLAERVEHAAAYYCDQDMPDMCHDHCRDMKTYLPHRWHDGLGRYQCAAGHSWTCTWGTKGSGEKVRNRGRAVRLDANGAAWVTADSDR